MNWSWLPNAITLARVLASLPLLWLLMRGEYVPAFWLALVAGASDALDGILAKTMGWESVLGGILDPIADKLLLSVCFFGLWWSQHLPTWLLAVVLGRDLVILSGAWAWWKLKGSFTPEPSGISKSTTLVQLLLVGLMLAHLAGYELAAGWLRPLMLATAFITLASGLDYVLRYGTRAWRERGKRE
jgi:cardiolipin synthase